MGFFQTFWADIEAAWNKVFGPSFPTLTTAVVADIKIVGSGLTGALAEFEALTGLAVNEVAKVTTAISNIEAGALSVAEGIETNVAQPIVTQIANDFQALQAALSGIDLPAALQNIMNAVITLLPYIEAGVGILTAGEAQSSATVKASEATGLTREQAQAILSVNPVV